jgi:hypothetical protein
MSAAARTFHRRSKYWTARTILRRASTHLHVSTRQVRMRRILIAVAAATALLIGSGGQAWADPPRPAPSSPLPSGWAVKDGELTWTSPRPVPMGDARVEFYSGDTLLGPARAAKDQRTFRLALPGRLTDLQARAGGRRLDASAPAPLRKQATPAVPAAQKPAGIDPGVKGPYGTITGEYSLPGVKLPDFPAPVEMQAVVVAPKGAPGRRPLALFLHGRHYTCFNGSDENQITGDWPCPAGTQPVPSYRGYLQAQRLLASQGYITVSISANGINGQDFAADDGGAQARSSLVRLHLADWADWAGGKRGTAPAVAKAAPPADMSKVFLMGHSRGGEGVSRAAMDSLNPPPAAQDGYHGAVRWTIRGLLLIGPTIFGHDPAPDVPSATILPGCDGDVSDLQGQMYADATRGVSSGRALHSALYAIGADHNFFNTEWTPGQAAAPAFDDFYGDDDPLCSLGRAPSRLTAAQQQTVGATYIATAARLFVAGDDRARPLLDGSGVRAPSAGSARVLSHAIGAARTAAIIPDTSVQVTNGRICSEVTDVEAQACLVAGQGFVGGSPHFVGFWSAVPEPGRYAVLLNGTGTATVRPAKPVSLAGAQSLALRLIVPPNSTGNRFGVSVVDTRGHRTSLGDVRVDGVPGTDLTTSYWAQELRVAVPRKLGAVARLELTRKGGSGQAWLIDAWGWRAGTPSPRPVALPRIDIGLLTVDEGDAGTRTYQVPVQVKGHGTGKVRMFLTDPATYVTKSWVADVKPTTKRISVPVSVIGNTRYGADRRYDVFAKAVRNTMIGHYDGGVVARNDDPMPAITVTPAAATAVEGSSLTWTVHLSEPADDYLYLIFQPQAPGAGPELSSTDVDPQWFTDNSGEDPEPSRPLSQTGLIPYVAVEPGTTSADLSIPIVADGVTEPAEHVRLQALVYPADFGDPIPVAVIDGTVTDS